MLSTKLKEIEQYISIGKERRTAQHFLALVIWKDFQFIADQRIYIKQSRSDLRKEKLEDKY